MAKAKDNHVSKSLHTLTVLVQVANLIERQNGGPLAPEDKLRLAWVELGFNGRPDPHGLFAEALSRLLKAA